MNIFVPKSERIRSDRIRICTPLVDTCETGGALEIAYLRQTFAKRLLISHRIFIQI